ncbi:DUF1059 domain-containing protein [Geomesophilobacter sediminis]|uniref:DUF1059 domain-containing protein n=1 Tax=Geomesophilobacter sediminis TaxID=2798584 RepID=A0A8J7LTF3_9BACT|nr:DUF1059 domain-containing protein [Geomesophilobacter sediminis]MBJ6723344.1 DUF1059 domain-containing protein [Geomesophilobacter sediminis]
MSKVLECSQVDPSSNCKFVARGETEKEILDQVAVHAKEHGINQVTPDLIARVKANIHEG